MGPCVPWKNKRIIGLFAEIRYKRARTFPSNKYLPLRSCVRLLIDALSTFLHVPFLFPPFLSGVFAREVGAPREHGEFLKTCACFPPVVTRDSPETRRKKRVISAGAASFDHIPVGIPFRFLFFFSFSLETNHPRPSGKYVIQLSSEDYAKLEDSGFFETGSNSWLIIIRKTGLVWMKSRAKS